jgi:actin-related protein
MQHGCSFPPFRPIEAALMYSIHSSHRFVCDQELLFSDTLPYRNHASNMLPLQKVVHESLTQLLDADLRKELSSNILLTGGASLFAGLDKRLSVELGAQLPSSCKYKVTASKNTVENRYSAWIGGSILSSLGSFQQLWLSKREYEECGAVLGLQRFKD